MYKLIKSLSYAPETHVTLCVDQTQIKKREKKEHAQSSFWALLSYTLCDPVPLVAWPEFSSSCSFSGMSLILCQVQMRCAGLEVSARVVTSTGGGTAFSGPTSSFREHPPRSGIRQYSRLPRSLCPPPAPRPQPLSRPHGSSEPRGKEGHVTAQQDARETRAFFIAQEEGSLKNNPELRPNG